MTRSNKEVDRAGKFLRDNSETDEAMLQIVSEWRSAHELALKRIITALRRHITVNDLNVDISGRTKRIRSILAKLQRQNSGPLTQMQDMGGCRAVVDTIQTAESLASDVRGPLRARLSSGGEISEKNYIAAPKPDGYRSIHFVVRYLPFTPEDLKPRKIEIQIRTQLQHRWATALETVDLFTGQSLKAGGGDPRWRRFFALASTVFAFQEARPQVPGTPFRLTEQKEEMQQLARELRIAEKLRGWSRAMQAVLDSRGWRNAYLYLVELDVEAHSTSVVAYDPAQLKIAHSEYLAREKANTNLPHRSVVLVTAHSLDDVRTAYPAFYGDTEAFLKSTGID